MELDLDSLINRVQATHTQYLEEKQRFTAELDAAQTETARVTSELTTANEKIEELSKEISTLNNTLAEKTEKLEKASSKEEVEQILNNDAAVYKELSNKYEALKEKNKTEIESLNKTIEELNKNAENFETYSNSLKSEIKEGSVALASLQNKYDDLENQKKDLDIAYKELKEKHNKSIETDADTDVHIADLEKQLQDKTNELYDANVKYDNLKQKTLGTIRHLVEDVIEPNEVKINNLQILADKANSMVDQNTYKASQDKVEELTDKVANLTRDNATKDARIVELTQQISKLTEEVRQLTPIKKAHSNLQNYIDSTIPIPEGTAASDMEKPIRATKDLSNTINTPFGKVSSEIMVKTNQMIDKLYDSVVLNSNNAYVLNNALHAAEAVGLSISTGNTIMDRLCAMSINGKPLVYFSGNTYYATINKDDLKNYILKG